MQGRLAVALVATACLVTASPARAQVTLTIDDGYVTLTAKDATIRQVLAEWSRVGQTRVINGDRITGGPVTLQLVKVPEAEALEILLRSVSGYMAAPRATLVSNASRFDRILVMPTSTPPRVAAAPPPAQQAFQAPTMPADDVDIDDQAIQPPPGGPGRGPVFPQFPGGPGQPSPNAGPVQRGPVPQPQPGGSFSFPQPTSTGPFPTPNSAAPGFSPPTPSGTMPAGVSTPGMMVMPPQQISPGIPVDPQP